MYSAEQVQRDHSMQSYLNNNSNCYDEKEISPIKALFESHRGDIYSAYSKDKEFFKREVSKLGDTKFLENGDLGITEERAKEIFPIFDQDQHLYLPRFPRLKGKCLKYLSSRVTRITFSDKSEPKNLKYLARLENLRVFISFYPLGENGNELSYLFQSKLTHIEMLCPPKHIDLKKILPPTLTHLILRSGSLYDENLSSYLEGAKQLKNLNLYFISTLTADAFSNSSTLESVTVSSCPGVDKEKFFMTSRALANYHWTQQEVSQRSEAI